MAEYIEREALLELYADPPNMKFDMFSVPIPVVRQNILDMPAAYVAPVVHARMEKGCMDEWYTHTHTCMGCGTSMMLCDENGYYLAPKVCANCGAHMKDGEGNG